MELLSLEEVAEVEFLSPLDSELNSFQAMHIVDWSESTRGRKSSRLVSIYAAGTSAGRGP